MSIYKAKYNYNNYIYDLLINAELKQYSLDIYYNHKLIKSMDKIFPSFKDIAINLKNEVGLCIVLRLFELADIPKTSDLYNFGSISR